MNEKENKRYINAFLMFLGVLIFYSIMLDRFLVLHGIFTKHGIEWHKISDYRNFLTLLGISLLIDVFIIFFLAANYKSDIWGDVLVFLLFFGSLEALFTILIAFLLWFGPDPLKFVFVPLFPPLDKYFTGKLDFWFAYSYGVLILTYMVVCEELLSFESKYMFILLIIRSILLSYITVVYSCTTLSWIILHLFFFSFITFVMFLHNSQSGSSFFY